MTRLWDVDPEDMCREHLLGEHKEMHQVVGTLRNHPHGLAIIEGHAEQGDIDTSLVQRRHDELAAEMERRGFDHDSPMKYDDEVNLGKIDPEYNRDDLRSRCDNCSV